ncbi:MAG: ligase-associated DNA damage response endonuclease PdeM [Cytophagales bacterium]|nr:ligase-associated DNA damage response endonuclease PdeM [Cytophagales bacterium]
MSDFSFIQKDIKGRSFCFLSSKAVYWSQLKTLIVADTHFGKVNHFRKFGINAPIEAIRNDLSTIKSMILQFDVHQIIIIGDMFHSMYNAEMDYWLRWRNMFSGLEFVLVKGNHDILSQAIYNQLHITIKPHMLVIQDFCFVHDITALSQVEPHMYYFSGHVHPALTIYGKAKQNLTLPCYFFDRNICILPAFGSFTGTKIISPEPGNQFIIIGESNIWELNPKIQSEI